MSAEIKQFPYRQSTPMQCVRNGRVMYVYAIEYLYEDVPELVYYWAYDNDDAYQRRKEFCWHYRDLGKLKDISGEPVDTSPESA